jgi:hypothetical protein
MGEGQTTAWPWRKQAHLKRHQATRRNNPEDSHLRINNASVITATVAWEDNYNFYLHLFVIWWTGSVCLRRSVL